jgi:type II secretory pathway component PulJ
MELLPVKARVPGHRGMVLLEVVIALTVFACVAFSLVVALNAATSAATDRNEVDAATVGLENNMAQVTGTRLATTTRDLPGDGSSIAYHLEVEPQVLQDDERKSFAGFYKVTLSATWKSGSESESRDLSELVYQP